MSTAASETQLTFMKAVAAGSVQPPMPFIPCGKPEKALTNESKVTSTVPIDKIPRVI